MPSLHPLSRNSESPSTSKIGNTMKTTQYAGIDYSLGKANRNAEGFHFGVISQHTVGAAWYDDSQPWYGKLEGIHCEACGCNSRADDGVEWGDDVECSHCQHEFTLELPDFAEPISHYVDNSEYAAECGEDGEIVVTRSPYYMHAQYCSPCFPGAGNCETECADGPKTLCFGHDWFDGGKAPYRVFSVKTGLEVFPS